MKLYVSQTDSLQVCISYSAMQVHYLFTNSLFSLLYGNISVAVVFLSKTTYNNVIKIICGLTLHINIWKYAKPTWNFKPKPFSMKICSIGNHSIFFWSRTCLRRSTDHLRPGYWLVDHGGSCCWMKLERPINSENGYKVRISALYTHLLMSVHINTFPLLSLLSCVCVCVFSKRVGVFCCGPKSISRTLHRLCNSFQSSETVFEFNKESFTWSQHYLQFEIKFLIKMLTLVWIRCLTMCDWYLNVCIFTHCNNYISDVLTDFYKISC